MTNTKQAQHAQTPWQYNEKEMCFESLNGETVIYADMAQGTGLLMVENADASFIVKAVNSHENLVDTLKWVLQSDGPRLSVTITKAIKEALKLAEEL